MGVWPGIGWSAVSAKASAMAVAASGMVGFGVVSEVAAGLEAAVDSEVVAGVVDGVDI